MKRLCILLLLANPAIAAIRGVVYDDHGAPVAHARVEAARAETEEALRARLLAGIERKPLATATTADDGTFTLDVKAAGVVQLLARSGDAFPAVASAMTDATDVVLLMPPAQMRSGRVTAGGKPVANAFVGVTIASTIVASARSGDDGRFALPVARETEASIVVVHPDFAPEVRTVGNGPVDVVLSAGTRLAGRVLGSNGKPAAGATLMSEQWPVGKSDEQGNFVVAHASGNVPLRAIRGSEAGTLREGVIQLEPKPSLAGTVILDMQPLAGAVVLATETTLHGAVTDEKGQYRIDALERGWHDVVLNAPGVEIEETGVDIRRAQVTRHDLAAFRQRVVRGIVRDETGKPVAGVRILIDRSGAPPFTAILSDSEVTRTMADGRFSAPVARSAGGPIRVVAVHTRYAVASKDVNPSDTRPVELTLTSGVQLKGLVTGEGGEPVAGAGILLFESQQHEGVLPYEEMIERGYARPLYETASDGTFAIPVNRGGKYDIGIWKTGYTGYHAGDLEPGGRELRIVLERGVEVRGRVVRSEGSAPIRGTITIVGDQDVIRDRDLPADGAFVFDSLRPGRYQLNVVTPQAERTKKIVDVPADNVLVELPPAGEVHVTVVDKDSGKPVTESSAYLMRESDDEGAALEAHGDSFSFVTTAGPVALQVSAPGYLPQNVDVDVDAKKAANVRVALVRGRTLHGRVTSTTGLPLAEASIGGEDVPETVVTDENGDYELEGLPPGPLTLTFQHEHYRTRVVTTPADAGTALDVVLAAGRSARGRVVTSGGEPVANAMVVAKSPASYTDAQQATTADDGTFTLEGLPDGRLSFEATKEELRTSADDVDIDAGPVVLTLAPRSDAMLHGTITGLARGDWFNVSVFARTGKDTSGMASVNRDGSWRMEHAPTGDVRVSAVASTANRQVTTPQKLVSVEPGASIEVNLAFSNVVVRGTIRERGQPAVMRSIAFLSKTRGDYGSWRTQTNTDGVYEIANLEPGPYEVHVFLDGALHYEKDYEVTGSATFDIDIDTTSIQGRVIDDRGMPVLDAQVTLSHPPASDDYTMGVNASGGFTFNVVAGTWTVTAIAKGFAAATQTVDAGGSPVVFQLTRTGGLKVRLVDGRDGHPIEGWVAATDGTAPPLRVRDLDASGAFTLPLTPGTYRLSASALGYGSVSRIVTDKDAMPIVVPLTPGGTLVIRSSGELRDVFKLVRPDGSEYVACECNGTPEIRPQGATTMVEHVATGSYVLQVLDAAGHVRATQPVTIREGETATVELH